MINKIFILLLTFLTLQGCSNFVNKFYKQIDDQDQKRNPKKYDKFDFFRGKKRKSLSKLDLHPISTSNFKKLPLNVKRKYISQRIKAKDLVDNENPGSLWIGRGQSNFLFSRNNTKRPGDIVLIKVTKNLKNDITAELKRTFPTRFAKRKAPKTTAKTPEAPAKTAEPQETSRTKIYDQISSIVTEEISKDHLIVKGRKQILFRGIKRLIEVKALVSRRDILDDDSILSKQMLESQIRVLR